MEIRLSYFYSEAIFSFSLSIVSITDRDTRITRRRSWTRGGGGGGRRVNGRKPVAPLWEESDFCGAKSGGNAAHRDHTVVIIVKAWPANARPPPHQKANRLGF